MKQIENSGFVELFVDGNSPEPERTVVVLGVARGGTSMMASALSRLGVFMGEVEDGNLEDSSFRSSWIRGDDQAVAEMIAARNASHAIWGTKFPGIWETVEKCATMFRNPVYVLVARDAISITARGISTGAVKVENALRNIDRVGQIYSTYCGFLLAQKRPTLLVSYEKAIASPRPFVSRLAAFLRLGDQFMIDDIVNGGEADHAAYLTRVTRDTARLRGGSGEASE